MSAVAGLPAASSTDLRAVEVVADGADRERVFAGVELRRREAEMALGVADHRDR